MDREYKTEKTITKDQAQKLSTAYAAFIQSYGRNKRTWARILREDQNTTGVELVRDRYLHSLINY